MKSNKTKVLNYFKSIGYLDLRSLGVFRIALGILIFFELIVSIQDVDIFYGVNAIRSMSRVTDRWFEVHTWIENDNWIYTLFIIQFLAAICLIVGYQTRWSALVLFVLFTSLHWRFSPILNASDKLLRTLLLMSVFMPVGRRFSLDSKLSKGPAGEENRYFSIWTLSYLAQLLFIYATAGYSKNNGTWNKGLGTHYSLHLATYAKWTTDYILGFPLVLMALNYMTLAAERAMIFLLLVNDKIKQKRIITALTISSFHFGLFLFLELGKFPWLGMILWLPMIPTEIWDQYLKSTPRPKLVSSPEWSNYAAVLFLTLMVYGNLKSYKVIPKLEPLATIESQLFMKQGWGVFKGPPKASGWIVSDAHLKNGQHADIFWDRDTVIWDKPDRYSAIFKNQNHREYFRNIRRKKYKSHLKRYVAWRSKQWNQSHSPAEQIDSVAFYYMKEPILKEGGYGPVKKHHLYTLK